LSIIDHLRSAKSFWPSNEKPRNVRPNFKEREKPKLLLQTVRTRRELKNFGSKLKRGRVAFVQMF
jgi:hypothetical protein